MKKADHSVITSEVPREDLSTLCCLRPRMYRQKLKKKISYGAENVKNSAIFNQIDVPNVFTAHIPQVDTRRS